MSLYKKLEEMKYLPSGDQTSGEEMVDASDYFNILNQAKTEFYDAIMDLPFPSEKRDKKLVELIKKWFGALDAFGVP